MSIYDEDGDEAVEAKALKIIEKSRKSPVTKKKSPSSVKKKTKKPTAKKKKKKKKAPTPSKRGLKILERATEAANREVKEHLEAGREVHGRCDGEPITIKPTEEIIYEPIDALALGEVVLKQEEDFSYSSKPKVTPEQFFASVESKPEYVKHLISCRCFLPQFKSMEIPPDHQFIVFSPLNEQGDINPHYAQCNNCGLIHKIFEVGLSQTLKKESMLTLPTIDDIKHGLPDWIVGLLELHDCDLHIYQEAEFIIANQMWGRFVVLAKERDDTMLLGKLVQILGDDLYKVETFERDESDVQID